MAVVVFTGWKVGMRGIPFIHVLRENTDLSLKRVKQIKEQIVDGEEIKISVKDLSIAEKIIKLSGELGVICKIE